MHPKAKPARALSLPRFASRTLRPAVAQLLAFLLLTQALVPRATAAPRVPPAPARTSERAAEPSRAEAPAPAAARAGAAVAPAAEDFGLVLRAVTTPFNGHAGLDHHQPSRKLVVSAHGPAGLPHNFELIEAGGEHRDFTNIAGLAGDLKLATARDDGQGMSLGGFRAGELFTTTGASGAVARVSPDGATVQNPWVVLGGDDASALGGLHVDRAGVFGGDLLAVTEGGEIWRVNSSGAAALVADLQTPLAGVAAVPDDAALYGPWAGRVLVGAKAQGVVYAVDAQGNAASQQLGLNAEDIRIIPPHENFYGLDPEAGVLWGAPAAAFTGLIGDILVAQGSPGVLASVRWNGTEFRRSQVAQVARWKQIAFSPAGVAEIPAVKQVYERIAVVRHAPVLDSGRVEGALWQLTPEPVTLDGTDTITSDLLVPGTPKVTVLTGGHVSFGGVIQGVESAQPAGYAVSIGGNASLRHLITRTDPISLEPVAAPPAPAGARDVALTQAGQSAGDFSTLRHLTISGKAGAVAVPPGTYGRLAASGRTAFVFGQENSAQPTHYNLEELSLSGGSELRVVGPVQIAVRRNVTLVGSSVGAAEDPRRVTLRIAEGALSVTGNAVLYGVVRIPQGAVAIEGNGRVRGTVKCDRLTVSGNGVLQITENDLPPPPVNRPPTVDAGADQTVTLPADTIGLGGTVADDGLPQGGTLSQTWTKVSGPGPVAFADAGAAATTATFSVPGEYVLRLTASDGLLTAADTLNVTIIPRNQSPTVNAGPDQTVELPAEAALRGTVEDDALPRGSTVGTLWSVVSGPGTVTFANAASTVTPAAFSAPGDYVLRLTADDTEFTVFDDLLVTVHPVNQPPTANAGPDLTVRLPQTARLEGAVGDDGWPFGSTLSARWEKVSGPGAVTFADAAAPVTVASFETHGTYVLRLSANDSRLEASDEATVVVLPANVGPEVDAGPDVAAQLRANLLRNGGNEEELFENRPAGWLAPLDAPWLRGAGGNGLPGSAEGAHFFLPGEVAAAELTQDVDVSAFAASIAAGTQQFAFETYVRSRGEAAPDSCQVFVEYRDAANQNVLATFDSGPLSMTAGWAPVRDARAAPAGTGWIRVRLLSTRRDGLTNDAYFDAASLRAVTGAGVKLAGRATDDGLPAGSALALAWTKASGPGEVMFADAAAAETAVTFTEPGTYVLRLTADDSEFSAGDEVTVAVVTANQPPTVEAGPEQTVTLPSPASLAGSAADDGLPGVGTLTVTWSKAGGPGEVTFADAHSAATTATFTEPGAYVLRLSAGDSEFTFHDETTVHVKPANRAPEVNAGPDQAVTLPNSAGLAGSAADDGQPAPPTLTLAWSVVSGPGAVVFGDPTQAATAATFAAPGTYVLRLSADDSELSASDEVTVVVSPAPVNQPPTVDAGPDRNILLTDSATLQGTVGDDGLPAGAALSLAWAKVSGPGAVTFADPAAAQTTAAFGVAGAYVLRLTASDSLLTASDDVQVVVRRAPVAGFTVPGVARNAATYDNNIASFGEGATVVSFSSQASTSFLPTFAIDDSHSTRWRSATGQIANQQLTLRLPGTGPRAFHRVRLVNADAGEGVKNFRVLVSTTTAEDDAFSVALTDAAINVGARVQEFVLPAPAEARFVRFVAVDNHGSTTNVALRSFELVDETLAGVPSYFAYPANVAAANEGARVVGFSSQSASSSLFAASAIDDNTSTAWLSGANQTANQHITVELGLGKVYPVDRVRLFNFEGTSLRGVRDFRVEVSDTTADAAGFRTVFNGTAQNAAGAQEFVFPQGATRARYVRLLAVNNYGSTTGVELRELQVITVPAGAPSATGYADGDERPEMVLDESAATFWRTAAGKVTNQSATFHLGGGAEAPLVEQALLLPSSSATTEAIRDFEVQVSATTADAAAFTTVAAGTVQNNAQLQKFAFPGGPVRARYARLVAKNNHGSPNAIRVSTFQLIASASEGNIISAPASANVARNQSPSLVANGATVAAASGQLNASSGPALMLDYVNSNSWSTPGTTGHFAVVKLAGGQAHTLRGVRVGGRLDVSSGADSVRNFEVWVSATTADDAAFSKVLSATALNNRTVQTFAFAAPAAARYVKYVPLTNYGSASTISTSNFDVLADGAGGVADYSTFVNASNRPEFAIDGSISSLWQTATGSVANQWITIALPGAAPQKVYGVRIDTDSSLGPKEFEVRVSETTADAAAFTTVHAGTLPQTTGAKEFTFGAARDARYVQFLWKSGYSTTTISTRELEVLAVPRTGAAVVASSGQATSTTGPAQALDYNRAGQPWLTPNNQAANQFLSVALPRHEDWTIDHVALEPDQPGDTSTPRNFEVQTSTTDFDDASFTTVLAGALRNEKVTQHYFFAPVRARYVRLLLKDNYGGPQMRLQTFWVFSPQVGGLLARFLDRTRDGGAPVTSYQWDFGDGQTSAERDPQHRFGAPGLYNVRLTVTDADQLTSSHTVPYEALGAPRVDFTFTPDPGREGEGVVFADASTDANGSTVTREWAWGDGSANTANATAPTHVFRDNGSYSVTLTAANDRGITDSATKSVPVVNLPPTANAGSNHSVPWGQNWNVNPSVSDPSSIDRATLRCDWEFGDGAAAAVANCDSTTARAPHSFGAPGVYTATLTVTDKDGGAASDTVVVTAGKRPTTIIYSGSRSVEAGQAVALRARLRDTLSWLPLAGKAVRFTLDGQTADAVTNAEGDAEATVVYNGTAATHSITAAFADDERYLGSSATVAAACPAESQPIDAVLVIDRSGSMSGQPLLDAQRGASIFVESLALARDQVGVVSFENSAKLDLGLTHDGAAALNAINTFALGGGTNIGSGIDAARLELTSSRRNPFASPVMLVLSDGVSSGDPAAAAQVAKNAGIRVIAIGLGGVDEGQMKAIASSPADYYFSASSANLGAIYSSIVSTLCKPANQPPAVNAGGPQTVTLPNASAALAGTVTDDGLPAGAAVTSAWSVVSGPGPVAFADAGAPVTTATFTEPGVYVLRLSASDTQFSRSSDVTVTVRQPLAGATLTLDPDAAGPNVTGTSQTLVATLKDSGGNPLGGMDVQFVVTGPNATSYGAPTDASGAATFTYTGRANGTDTVAATAGAGTAQVQSNASLVSWVTPVQAISTTTVLGRFFTSNGSGVFSALPTQQPVFNQHFPTINFNPPAGTVPGNTSGVNPNTHPFTNVTTDHNGNFTGTIPAQGNGLQAGVGTLFDFNAVFTGTFTVAAAGDITFNFFSDDGFIFGVGGGATRVGGANTNAPASGLTPFENLPVMGAYNVPTAPVANSITVRFPAPGTYAYEVDYSECCGGELSLTMTTAASGNRGVPPSGALALTPNSVPQRTTGEQQTFQVAAVDASGAALANLPVVLTVAGANGRQVNATTDAAGRASFTYAGQNPGTDSVQVSAPVGGMTAYSNVVPVQWKAAANQAPSVSAGPDQSVTLPASTVNLSGTVTDDGLPLGGALSASWAKVSGPGTVVFGSTTAAATSATFGSAGTYVLRLTASDTQVSASDEVTVTVNPAAQANQAPVVSAGPDQTVVLPASANLAGAATDDGLPSGAALASTWSKVSGPGAVSFANPNAPATSATFGSAGTYVLRLSATDSELTAADEVTVNVLPPATPNTAPVVSAGPDLTTAMGVNLLQNGGNEAALGGGEIPSWTEAAGTSWTQATAGADGFPAAFEGATYFYAGEAAAAELRQDVDLSAFAATLGAGTQQFEFQARLRSRVESTPDAARVVLEYRSADNSRVLATLDSGPITFVTGWLTTEDTRAAPAGTGWIRIRLIAARNTGATNDAYFDGVSLRAVSTAGVKLGGTVTDDGLPSGAAVTSAWSVVSGPGAVRFANTGAAATSATFEAAGTYVLRLSASDTQLSTSDDVTVTVIPVNRAPVVNAGADQTITLPNETVLSGTVTDDNLPQGSALQISWTKVSGPGAVTFADPAAAHTEATFGAEGTYVLRLSATDSELTASDDITITVKPAPPNQAPQANAGPDQSITLPVDTVTLNGGASDDGLPSGSTLTTLWAKVSGPGAVTFADPAAAQTTATFAQAGVYVLRLTASDSQLSAADEVTVSVNGVNAAPAVNAGPDLTVTLPGTATLDATATDDGLPLGSTLQISWAKVSGPGTVTFTNPQQAATAASFGAEGTYVLRLSATDSALATSDDVTVTVNPAVPPPTVGLASPADGSVITGRTVFVGTVSQGSSWRLEYKLGGDVDDASPQGWTTISSGNTPVTNGTLGVFDPTVMLNGTYKVRLVATDAAGQSSFITASATVEGNQKVGNFTVSFKDLFERVGGLPIEVLRTYDSRDKRVGDFGVGWTMALKNVRIEKSQIIGKHWQQTVSGGVFPLYCLSTSRPTFVSVVLPDGKVQKFEARASRQSTLTASNCQQISPITSPSIYYAAAPGSQGQLVSLEPNDPLVFGSIPGPVEMRNSSDFGYYNPQLFRYTATDGTVYVIHQQAGVRSVTDTNGNTLTVDANGIAHSDGQAVTFTRDALGRVTEIRDTAGNAMSYTYSAAGDLAGFTDRDGHTTTFTYNATHGLLKVLDPLNRETIFNQYDASGRLTGHTDADGKTVNYAHDLDGRKQTVTDRLGNATLLEYDASGNVTRSVDPKGGVTVSTYDSNNNLLSETDPLGHTTAYTYDALDNVTSVTDALGSVTRFTYNQFSKPLTATDARGGVTTYTYDAGGNVTSVTDPLGRKTTHTYGWRGARTSTTDPFGNVTTYGIDIQGRVVSETGPAGGEITYAYVPRKGIVGSRSVKRTRADGTVETLVTSYQYDRSDRLIKTTYPDGTTGEIVYDAAGLQTASIDQQGRRTAFDYDDQNRLIRVTHPDQTKEELGYDAEGRRTRAVDAAGRATAYAYDSLGRLEKTTYADGAFTTTSYDAADRALAVADERGNVTRYEYDAVGRQTKVTDAAGRVSTFTYDADGNQLTATDPAGRAVRFEYDANSRLTRVVFPDQSERRTAYDLMGRVVSRTDQAGKVTQYEYDAAGRLKKVTDAAGGATAYGYDEEGRPTSQTDALGRVTRFEYDSMGRRTKRTLPLGMSETYAYDASGRMTGRTNFLGKTTTYAYDAQGRLLTRTPDPTLGQPAVTFTYTATGQRATMTDASGATTYAYDARDRLASRQTPQGTLAYTYDAAGNLLTVRSSNADGVSTDYAYDAAGRLATAADGRLGGATAYTYDAAGNLEGVAYPNGVKSTYTYNSLNRLTGLAAAKAGTTLASYAYTLGPAGHRLAVAERGGRSVAYTYDDLYRLTSEAVTGDPSGATNGTIDYTYDAVGNRLTRASTNPAVGAQSLAYDANNRLGGDGHDANGNTVSAQGSSFSYDFEDRLTEVNGGAVRYVYDGDGNRVAKTAGGVTTRYLVDTNNHTGYAQVVEELQGGQVVRQYTYGHDLVSQRQLVGGQWQASFYGYDGHGSVRYLTDSDGAVTDTYDYDAFGALLARTGSTPNEYLYAGERFDPETGLYYLRARLMNPQSGRFWTMDTYEGRPAEPLSLHKYVYAHDDPVNNLDPSGHMSIASMNIGMAMMLTLAAMATLLLLNTLSKVKIEIDISVLPRPAPTPEPSPDRRPPPIPPIPRTRPDDDDRKEHRGSIQAQGDGIRYGQRTDLGNGVIGDGDTVSWKWAQPRPLSLVQGLEGLEAVKSKMTKSQLRDRDKAFDKAQKFMYTAAAGGGAGPKSYTFQNPEVQRRRGNQRVDIVVNSGVAFVMSP